jgi:hypothetical protein
MILLLKLILAHLIGDFFLQSDAWIEDKEKRKWKSGKLVLHILVHAALLAVVIISESGLYLWGILPIIVLSHWLIDALKLQFQGKDPQQKIRWFIADQIAHIAIIVGIWMVLQDNWELFDVFASDRFWMLLTGGVLLTQPTATIVKVIISRWTPTNDKKGHSLADAGKFIGILERLFVFGFIISANWEGIGFLLAAKSVFRFGDLNEAKDRNLTEYVLIGTLISFGIAIIVGVLYNALV